MKDFAEIMREEIYDRETKTDSQQHGEYDAYCGYKPKANADATYMVGYNSMLDELKKSDEYAQEQIDTHNSERQDPDYGVPHYENL